MPHPNWTQEKPTRVKFLVRAVANAGQIADGGSERNSCPIVLHLMAPHFCLCLLVPQNVEAACDGASYINEVAAVTRTSLGNFDGRGSYSFHASAIKKLGRR
jgi:hypothetical protein